MGVALRCAQMAGFEKRLQLQRVEHHALTVCAYRSQYFTMSVNIISVTTLYHVKQSMSQW